MAMADWSREREALRGVAAAKWLWVAQALGNAVALGLIWLWLSIADSTPGRLAASAVIALFTIVFVLWVHGTAFAFFGDAERDGHAGLRWSLGASFRHLPGLLLWAAILIAGLLAVARMGEWAGPAAQQIASTLTFRLNRPVSPQSIRSVFSVLVFVLFWILLPAVLIPLGVPAARRGLSGFREWGGAFRVAGNARYWLVYATLFALGIVLPWLLMTWVPAVPGLPGQAVSLAIRWGAAYALAITAWLTLISFAGALQSRPGNFSR
jgi:hypothetical protein